MASFQQGNDYQTYQVNPYQAPNQQIIQAIGTRNQYWDSAASSLKNAYQNYLGLDLSRADNHQRLNQLMQGVNENLQKVSKTDLSIGENYGAAMNIFDPIIKDDNIMGDNAITKYYKQEFSTAQNYRNKDNGKGYSATNVQDLSNHLQDFVNDPNASNWRSHYASRSQYTPYTDVAAEVRQVGKDFKPDTKVLSGPMSLNKDGSPNPYMMTTSDKSIIASQYRAFLDAHLSDKAKGQLAIEGRVRYHDNPAMLAQDYTQSNQDRINSYSSQIKDLNGRMAGATDDLKAQYTDQINDLQSKIKDTTIENTKIKSGDLSNFTPYKNQIAAGLYTNNYVDNMAKASAQKNIEVKYTPNQVWKTMFDEQNENDRLDKSIAAKWGIAEMSENTKLMIAGLKGANGQPLTGIQGYATSDKSNDQNFGPKEFTDMQTQSGKDWQNTVDQFNKKIFADKKIDPTDLSIPVETRNAAVSSWMNDPRNKSDMAAYNAAAAKKGSEDQMFGAINDLVDQTLKKNNPDAYNYRQNILNKINTGQNLVLTPAGGGAAITANLSPSDIRSIIEGKNSTYKLGSKQEYVSSGFTGPGMGSAGSMQNIRTLTVDGKEYKFNYGSIGQTINDLDEGAKDYTEQRNKILTQNINKVMGIESLYQDDKNPYYKAVHNLASRVLMGSDEIVKPEDIVPFQKDKFGDVFVKVQAGKDVKLKELTKRVEAEGGRYIEADDKFMLPGKLFGSLTNSQRFTDPKLDSIQTLVDVKSSMNPNDRFSTFPQTWGNRNFQFKVDVQNGNPSYRIIDPVTGGQFGKDDSGTPFETLESAAAGAELLGNLNLQDYTNKTKTVGGVPGYQPQ